MPKRAKASVGFKRRLERIRRNYAKQGTIGTVARPSDVSPDAFGLKIVGNCLAPRAREGQVAVIEQALPQPGELIALWLKGRKNPIIKVLSRKIDGFPVHPDSEVIPAVDFEQLNPPARYSVWMNKIEAIARARVIDGEEAQ